LIQTLTAAAMQAELKKVCTQRSSCIEMGRQSSKRTIEPKGDITMRGAFAIKDVTHDGVEQSPGAFQ
jgi:hypothetical protein